RNTGPLLPGVGLCFKCYSDQALAELRRETRKVAFRTGGIVDLRVVVKDPAVGASVVVLMHSLDARLHQRLDEQSRLLGRVASVPVSRAHIEAGANTIQMQMRA